MNAANIRHSFRSIQVKAIALAAVVGPLGMVTPPPARAQNSNPPANTTNVRQKPLSAILTSMSRAAGVSIVADSSVGGALVNPLATNTTPQNFENQIAELVKSLPQGTVWAKLQLPEPKGRRDYSGDDVAAYAMAQAKLFGNVGGDTGPGEIELLGQRVTADKASNYVAGLNLKPVYLITNPSARLQGGILGLTDPNQWAAMSQEQKSRTIETAAQQLANMDPQARQQLMQQNMMIFGAMMRMLPPDQRSFNFVGPNGPGVVRVIATPAVPATAPEHP
jgi:hypothetical protein